MKPASGLGLAGAAAALLIDQATKAVVVANAAALSAGIPIVPGFNLVFLRNDGVSFGLLGGAPAWILVAIALALCGWLAAILFRAEDRIEALACGSVIGGALGNVADRLRFRGVTDFLDFYIGAAHWPAFNLADVFVVCGVAGLLLAPALKARRAGAD